MAAGPSALPLGEVRRPRLRRGAGAPQEPPGGRQEAARRPPGGRQARKRRHTLDGWNPALNEPQAPSTGRDAERRSSDLPQGGGR